MTKAITLDDARGIVQAARILVAQINDGGFVTHNSGDGSYVIRIDFAGRRKQSQDAHSAIVALGVLINGDRRPGWLDEFLARQEIAALSDGDRTRAENAQVGPEEGPRAAMAVALGDTTAELLAARATIADQARRIGELVSWASPREAIITEAWWLLCEARSDLADRSLVKAVADKMDRTIRVLAGEQKPSGEYPPRAQDKEVSS